MSENEIQIVLYRCGVDIERGISGFVKYWEDLCNVDVTGEY